MDAKAERIALEREILELRKKLSDKESLLPGVKYLEAQQRNKSKASKPEGMRLRLGEGTRLVLEYLVTKSGFSSLDTIISVTKLDSESAKTAVRNLIGRALAEKDDAGIKATDLGKEFLKEYQAKN